MKWALLFTLLLVPGFATASLEYWSVPGDDVQDVINSANFAATMKGATGVSFTGKTREQLDATLSEKSLNDVVVVILDGDEATIMAGVHREFEPVVANARAYLLDQGFDVEVSEPDVDKVLIKDTTGDEPEPEDNEPIPTLYDATVPEEPEEQIDPPSLQLEAGPADDDIVEEDASDEEPGFFSTLWSWFAGLFS